MLRCGRPGRTALVGASLWALGVCGAGAEAVAAPDFSGVWALDPGLVAASPANPGPNGLLRGWKALAGWKTNGNTPPPLRAQIYATIKARQTLELAGKKEVRAAACKPAAIFDLMSSRPKLSIFQSWRELVMLADGERMLARHIYIGHEHPPAADLVTSINGNAMAHWDGQTLVVDTVGIDPGPYFNTADFIPQSDKMHVVEHIRLQGPDTLADTLTVTDPDVLTRPWTVNLTFHKQPSGTEVAEVACIREEGK
jgi:hypothetical protein